MPPKPFTPPALAEMILVGGQPEAFRRGTEPGGAQAIRTADGSPRPARPRRPGGDDPADPAAPRQPAAPPPQQPQQVPEDLAGLY